MASILAKIYARRSYDAINRGEVAGIMAGWHDDATPTYPLTLSVSGTRKGRDAIEAWFRHFNEAVPTGTFRLLSTSVQNCFDVVGENVIAIEWDNRPANRSGEAF